MNNNGELFPDPKFYAMVRGVCTTLDSVQRHAAIARLHAASIDQALFVWIDHDVAPPAMIAKVQSFVLQQFRFVDLSKPYIYAAVS